MLEAAASAPSASKTSPVIRPYIGFLSFLTISRRPAAVATTSRLRDGPVRIFLRAGCCKFASRVKIQLQEITDRRLEARRGRPACDRLLGFDLYDQGVVRQSDVDLVGVADDDAPQFRRDDLACDR